ncbi:transmembrane protein 161A precursor, partial [Silurus asotus]
LSSSAFDSVRLWMIVGLCVLRLLLTRQHLQAYLNLAPKWVEQMKKEAGRIAAVDIQRKA